MVKTNSEYEKVDATMRDLMNIAHNVLKAKLLLGNVFFLTLLLRLLEYRCSELNRL